MQTQDSAPRQNVAAVDKTLQQLCQQLTCEDPADGAGNAADTGQRIETLDCELSAQSANRERGRATHE